MHMTRSLVALVGMSLVAGTMSTVAFAHGKHANATAARHHVSHHTQFKHHEVPSLTTPYWIPAVPAPGQQL